MILIILKIAGNKNIRYSSNTSIVVSTFPSIVKPKTETKNIPKNHKN